MQRTLDIIVHKIEDVKSIAIMEKDNKRKTSILLCFEPHMSPLGLFVVWVVMEEIIKEEWWGLFWSILQGVWLRRNA